ncbi:hypothetical protein J4462_01580 [Candidatus Pacearchaeota archaeon]|nr:hypothetical protein [Candidatus Pacearchaeota archaeon]
MSNITQKQFLEVIRSFAEKRVLVLGDSIIDEYIYGVPFGKSLSSPNTPKLKYERTELFRGGACNVAENLLALGGKISLITVVGDDPASEYHSNWSHSNLNLHAVVEKGRRTTVKSRFSDGTNKLLAVERFDDSELAAKSQEDILNQATLESKQSDAVILQDQGHGFFSSSLVEKLREATRDCRVLVNSQIYFRDANHSDYAGFHTIFVNYDEARKICEGFNPDGDGMGLTQRLHANVCVTLGRTGSVYFREGNRYYAESVPTEVVDSCGAGDSFLAAFALSDFEARPDVALKLANIWAGLSVQKKGTKVPNIEDLIKHIKENFPKGVRHGIKT